MSVLLPAGMLPFRVALARIAQARLPEEWASAKLDERAWLAEGTEVDSFRQSLFTRSDTVTGRAYEAIRASLAEGVLPAVVRGQNGSPETVPSAFWLSKNADRLAALATGDILIGEADLTAVLSGKPAPSRLHAPKALAAKAKGGRPSNPEADQFWAELCRLVASGSLPCEQAAYTRSMAQWAIEHMASGYDEETIRKKVRKLFDALHWRR